MDPAIILAIVTGAVSIVSAVVAGLIKAWHGSVGRETKAKNEYIAHLLAQNAESNADRRNLEQRLQFFIDTIKAQGELLAKSVSISEKSLEFNDKLLERVEAALGRLERPANARDRASDKVR